MSETEPGMVTELLVAWSAGDRNALGALVPLMYADLHAVAHRQLQDERPDHTLQATALVHEAYLRLVDQTRARFRDRLHFLSVAAGIMRRILVDHARRRGSQKRGGEVHVVVLDEARSLADGAPPELIALDDALESLAEIHPQLAQLVELRFFGGLGNHEVATFLGVSVPTVTRRMRTARAWLFRHLRAAAAEAAPSA